MSSEDLDSLRAQINSIDEELVKLINERAKVAQKIGEAKRGSGSKYRPDREAEVLDRVKERNKGPLSDKAVASIQREVMSWCLALEKPLTIAYLGPEGTFSQLACVKHFGNGAITRACKSVGEALRLTEGGQCDYAAIPVENSTEGSVGKHLDLLIHSPLVAVGEVNLRIRLQLLSKFPMDEIKVITAHPQALGQCRKWIQENLPDAEIRPATSNGSAAKCAAETDEKGVAAIASKMAAELYNLEIVAPNIEDEPNNTTRFLIMGENETKSTGADKTSLVVSAPNRAGAVYDLIEPLNRHGVSMCKLESRPSKLALWDYFFFIDVEGHHDDDNVKKALDEIQEVSSFFRIIGSYPTSRI